MDDIRIEGCLMSENIVNISEGSGYWRKGELNVSAYNEDKSRVYYYKLSISEVLKALKSSNFPFMLVKQPRKQYRRLYVEREDSNYDY